MLPPHRILISPDKFKGTLTARQAAEAIARGLRCEFANSEITILPIADGGEGTVEALASVQGSASMHRVPTMDAYGRPRNADVVVLRDVSVCESASPLGLVIIEPALRDPWKASSRGLGLLLRDLAARGAKKIFVGLGGSATNDAGLGLAAALGWIFMDESGHPVDPLPVNFAFIQKLVPPEKAFAVEVVGLCDVNNPLLGADGASLVYGPQKGLAEPVRMDAEMARIADLVAKQSGLDYRNQPGAGAAGGLGYGLLTFACARLAPGFETIADLLGISEAIAGSDLVITGEGRIDRQTLFGKGPAALAKMAASHAKPVVAFCGQLEAGADEQGLFAEIVPMVDRETSAEVAVKRATETLELAAARFAARWIRRHAGVPGSPPAKSTSG
ncbi:glycerate kinase [Nibricoccus aquaticus]|uniref:Glycerate kinase n=1 Tax=Nibricoccus aquaticus TaxID=2576891 RepID=A0A290QEY6_9BACT|nr:glycerate kinase [Nibricoccus aquaticus]ATC65800.1 glycerate kinase [Nibricoccus aquaticus]